MLSFKSTKTTLDLSKSPIGAVFVLFLFRFQLAVSRVVQRIAMTNLPLRIWLSIIIHICCAFAKSRSSVDRHFPISPAVQSLSHCLSHLGATFSNRCIVIRTQILYSTAQ